MKSRAPVLGRPSWVWLHRWLGLVMAGFLIVVGLTGSLLAYDHELERVFAPQLFAQARAGAAPLDLATLAERAQQQLPEAQVLSVTRLQPDQVLVGFAPRPDPVTGRPRVLGFDELYIDPWTGQELGRRQAADLSAGLVNLMPFVYELHWRLVAGSLGQWILGIVALLWTLDNFNGLYLTLPRRWRGFRANWGKAWKIRRGAGSFRFNFDLHRAGGLWLWIVLLVFAWSSVMMNIRPAYEAVMRTTFDYVSPGAAFQANGPVRDRPLLDWSRAQQMGERWIQQASREHGLHAGERLSFAYLPELGAYLYEVRGNRDLFERAPQGGGTTFLFDGDSGSLREFSQPTGEHAGNTVESWLYALHMARVFGRPWQLLVCLLGIAVAALSVTGIYIWWRKRRARQSSGFSQRSPRGR